jgi:2-C-methyl-D-erythritol 4-phosphate cytidylyltransferase
MAVDAADSTPSKVLLPLLGEPLLRRTVRVFQEHPAIAHIRVVMRPLDRPALDAAFADRGAWGHLGAWVVGGAERQDSVRLGLEALAAAQGGPPDRVLVHDGARPLCSPALIQATLDALQAHDAIVPVLPVFDTVRSAPTAAVSGGVVDRANLRVTQTPQAFRWDVLWEAHRWALAQGFRGTDDGQLVERRGHSVGLVRGERRNLKVTEPEDLALAEWIAAHPAWGRL